MSETEVADVLLVDSSTAHLLALGEALAGLAVRLVRVGSADEAVRHLSDRAAAVMFVALGTPGLDGFEAVRRVRAADRSRHPPVIFLDGPHADPAAVAAAYRLGAVDFLTTPVAPEVVRGKVTGFADLFRERAAALREADQLRLLVHGTTEYAIFLLDPGGRILTWNAGAERIKGYAAADIVGRHFSIFYTPDDLARDHPTRELEVARATGRYEEEGWRVRKDGTRLWANVVITALRDAGGRLRGFSKVTRDLTDRKHREEALRQSEERFRLLVETVQDYAIFMLDPAGRVATWNAGAARLKGYAAADIVGRHFSAFYPRDAVARGWPAHELEVAAAVGRFEDEGWRVRKDGSTFWANVVITALRDAAGSLVGYAKVTRDLTDRKHREDELERRVEERTAALAAANAALQAEDRRKDEFIALFAHELRNPLAPIRNALAVLQLGPDAATVERVRQMVGRQVGQLTHIVEDMLEVARLRAGKVALRPALLDLAQLARHAAADEGGTFAAAGVDLAVDAPDTPVWVTGDRTRLTQVVGNLLQNAAKFTDRGGRVAVVVRPAGGHAELAVRDTGVGIPADLLARLFTPFTQAHQGSDRSKGGLGLGLSLVKGLVELHGGSVTAGSAGLGRGSEFVVRLPLAAEPAPVTGRGTVGHPGRPVRVLVVEDNRDAAESLRMVLELVGCEVAVAHTGPDGVDAAKRLRPALVVCDIGLPGFDGFEVARRIRAEASGVVLVALTGYGTEADRESSRSAGFNAHFVKPVDFADLQTVIGGVA